MLNLRQNPDGSIGFFDEATAQDVFRLGGPGNQTGAGSIFQYRGGIYVKMQIGGPTDTAGALGAVLNPFGKTVYFGGGALLVSTTQSAGACTVSVGPAANATTLAATLFSGVNVASATQFNSVLVPAWTATQFLTASTASGASSGLVGFVMCPVLIP